MISLDEKYADIVVNRYGKSPESNMTTTKILREIYNYKNYVISQHEGLLESRGDTFCSEPQPDGKNKYVAIDNTWDKDDLVWTGDSNILGESGIITLNEELEIPVSKKYSFFGVKLYKVGDTIQFRDTDVTLPLCDVDIGINYIDDYLMKKAGGIYVEYHDRPHFHMPRDKDAGGYIIIGREIDEYILLAAFEIPYGYALYTPSYVIHNDCFLLGKYMVVYSKTKEYSNVLFQNSDGNPVRIRICPEM